MLEGHEIDVIVDETGDPKKAMRPRSGSRSGGSASSGLGVRLRRGSLHPYAHQEGKTTDYVKRQYIGNLGKIENGIVSVNAYGHYQGITFPLKFKIFKPKERLKEGDESKSKPVLGFEIIKELKEKGFKIKRVLADSH